MSRDTEAAIQAERTAAQVQSLADIGFRLASIDREIGGIHSDIRYMSMRTVMIATVSTSITSLLVSALTAVVVVNWLMP